MTADAIAFAEQALLGALLLDGSARERANGLAAGDFGSDQHRLIFRAIGDALDDDGASDPVSVFERLQRAGKDAEAGGIAYLNGLAANTPGTASAGHYAKLIHRAARDRRLRAKLAEALAAAERGDADTALRFAAAAADLDERAGSPTLLDLAALAATEPTPPRFVVAEWMPEGTATLLAGHGGSGKSLVALTAAVCIAAGRAFFGLHCARRRVLFASYEDCADVLHWRLRRVCDMLGVDLASLAGWLFVADASEAGEPLYVETRDGLLPTSAFDWLRQRMRADRAEVLMLDGTADAFAGNENARAQVRAFVQALRRLMPRNGAVLLLHHVDAGTAHGASSKAYSGSTAWHNSCRARWYLRPTEEGEQADLSRMTVELRKSNHGKPGATLGLRFSEPAGCFVSDCELPAGPLDRANRESGERAAVLALIRRAEAAGDPVPTATRGERTAHAFAEARGLPDALHGKRGKARFYAHVEALRAAGAVRVDAILRPNRHYAEVYRAAAPATERASATEHFSQATEHDAPATEH
jgi:KaiC/GvpD/RAD55 family RecA-like ATPase